jgi:hypothetical protein
LVVPVSVEALPSSVAAAATVVELLLLDVLVPVSDEVTLLADALRPSLLLLKGVEAPLSDPVFGLSPPLPGEDAEL